MNVDPAELQKFNALAEKWWDLDGTFRALHAINPRRLQWIESMMPLSGKKVLDAGCGGGILSEAMAKRGAQVTGIDLASETLQAAQTHSVQSGLSINYRKTSVENMANEEAGQYDIVTCMEMLEHVPDPLAIVQACARLLKPEGIVFFSTLNRNLKSFLCAIIGAEYILGLLPKGTHNHERFLTPAELAQFARQSQMDVAAITGISYRTGTNFYLSKDVSINYMMACKPLPSKRNPTP